MTAYGMFINAKACVGCHACRLACQNQNGLPADVSFITFHERETGQYPNLRTETTPTQCMQCDDAPLRSGVPHQGHVAGRGRRRAHGHDPLHRVPLLHGGVPLRRTHARPRHGHRRQVPLLRGRWRRDVHQLRDRLSCQRAHLGRLGRPRFRGGQGRRRAQTHSRSPRTCPMPSSTT